MSTKCELCHNKPCENNPYNPDGECWNNCQVVLASIADGKINPNALWWVKFPWADSIEEIADDENLG